MKNLSESVKKKLISKYLEKPERKYSPKSTNINILLNRVKINEKTEVKKKIFFSAFASTGLILFGFLIF